MIGRLTPQPQGLVPTAPMPGDRGMPHVGNRGSVLRIVLGPTIQRGPMA